MIDRQWGKDETLDLPSNVAKAIYEAAKWTAQTMFKDNAVISQEDCIQEIFIGTARNIIKISKEKGFSLKRDIGLLRYIVKYRYLDVLKKVMQTKHQYNHIYLQQPEQDYDKNGRYTHDITQIIDPWDSLESIQFKDDFEYYCTPLTPREKKIVTHFVIDRMTNREIGALDGINVSESRISQILSECGRKVEQWEQNTATICK